MKLSKLSGSLKAGPVPAGRVPAHAPLGSFRRGVLALATGLALCGLLLAAPAQVLAAGSSPVWGGTHELQRVSNPEALSASLDEALNAGLLEDYVRFKREASGPQRLLHSSLRQAHQAARSGLPVQAASGLPDMLVDNDRVLVEIRAADIERTAGDMAALDAEVLHAAAGGFIEAWVPAARLEDLAALPGMYRVWPARPVQLLTGSQTTQGVVGGNAHLWHDAGLDGDGITIAIIDQFNDTSGQIAALQGSGDWPQPADLTTVGLAGAFGSNGSNHGNATLEIAFDVAPGANFIAYDTQLISQWMDAIDMAVAAGADVISASLGSFLDGVGDGTAMPGSVAERIEAAAAAGVIYINAAGNERQNHWGGLYNPGSAFGSYVDSLDWGAGGNLNASLFCYPTGYPIIVTLHWDDWTNVDHDYDLFLAQQIAGEWEIVAESDFFQDGGAGQTPQEFIVHQLAAGTTPGCASGTPVAFLVARWDAPTHRNLQLFTGNVPAIQQFVPESSIGFPADSTAAIAVAAIDAGTLAQESYSSEGPLLAPGGGLPTGGEPPKPEVSSFANVDTVSYGAGQFNGTSAAAPHVAGMAALLLQRHPGMSREDVVDRLLQISLTGSNDLGDAGIDTLFGYGRTRFQAEDYLEVAQQPTDTQAGSTINAVEVLVMDDEDEIVLSGPTGAIAAAIGNDPSGGSAVLSGTLSQAVDAGVTVFGDLSIDIAGGGYTLDFASDAAGTAVPDAGESDAFNVSGVGGPIANITPASFSFTVLEDEADDDVLNIGNVGDEDLVWSIDTANAPASVRGVTVLLEEDFSDTTFPPAGWTAYDLDGGNTEWERIESSFNSAPASAFHMWDAASQVGWLVMPQLTLGTGTSTLTFAERTQFTFDYRYHGVMVSTASCVPTDGDFVELAEIDDGDETWRPVSLDLSAYAGEDVCIGFLYDSEDGANWYVDDVMVTTEAGGGKPSACDDPAAIGWLSVDPENGTTGAGGNVPVDVMIDADGLAIGDYDALLCVTTNDPNADLVEIPVSLTVTDVAPGDPVADITPLSFSFELDAGDIDDDVLNIGNTGGADLIWAIEDEPVTMGRGGFNPALDEVLDVDDFSVTGAAGGGPVETFDIPAGVATQGTVIGFTFEGTASGISGLGDWASDTRMIITSPEGAVFNVGGFSAVVNDWDFQGGGSTGDGTYTSTHLDIFGVDGTADAGDWTLEFSHDWDSPSAATINWSDVTITLHKTGGAGPEACTDLGDVDWLSVSPDAGTTAAGNSTPVSVTVDTDGLAAGSYGARLCVTTNDPEADLVQIPVSLTVNAIAPEVPVVDVSPPSLVFEVEAGDADDAMLQIGNQGDAVLTWDIFTAQSTAGARGSDIVTFDNVNFAVPQDNTGGSVQWTTGDTCACDTAPFNFNIYEAAGEMAFFWPLISGVRGAGVSLDGTTYAVLNPGDTVGPASDFLQSGSPDATVDWRQSGGVDGYLGFEFINPVTSQTNYGYVHITTTGTSGFPATIVGWAYNQVGDPITIAAGGDCADPSSVPWLSVNPDSGSTPAGGSVPVTVAVNTAGLGVGDYQASVCVASNDPETPLVAVPVSLEVTPGANAGIIAGTVTSAGYCDDNPAPLAGAEITVTGGLGGVFNTTTNGDGEYSIPVPADESPVDVMASAAGHLSDTETGVAVTEGDTTTVDFTLTAELGCTEASPESMSAFLFSGQSDTQVLTLSNSGAADSTFSVTSRDEGFVTTVALPGGTWPARDAGTLTRSASLGARVQSPRSVEVVSRGGSYSVLVVSPDGEAGPVPPNNLVNDLNAFPDVTAQLHAGALASLTVGDLEPFDVVVTTNNNRWSDAGAQVVIGNVLADYIDGGGKVIVHNFAYDFAGWQMGGRFITENYGPVTLATSDVQSPTSMVIVEPTSPIFDNVTSVGYGTNFRLTGTSLTAGAELLAEWGDGVPMVTINDNVLSINAMYSSEGAQGDWTGDLDIIVYNGVRVLAGEPAEPAAWLSFDPETGSVAAQDTETVDVTFTALPELDPGTYFATILVTVDDGEGEFTIEVPVEMEITDEPLPDAIFRDCFEEDTGNGCNWSTNGR